MSRDELIQKIARGQAIADGGDPDYVDTKGKAVWTYYIDKAIAFVAALEAAGVVLAPKEPIKEMLLAGNDGIDDDIDFWNYDSGCGYSVEPQAAFNVWKRMLAANPYRSAP
jgi:hypothetical protein